MIPLMQEYRMKYLPLPLYLRGDSGFAPPALYEACVEKDCNMPYGSKTMQRCENWQRMKTKPCLEQQKIIRLTMSLNTAYSYTRSEAGHIRGESSSQGG